MQGALAEMQSLGANLVAICPQRPEFLKQMREKHGLEFDILRDVGNEYAHKLGLRYAFPDYLKEIYLQFPVDLARINGEPSWTLSMSARYVVNRFGSIITADFDPDYTKRPEPEKTVNDLRKIS